MENYLDLRNTHDYTKLQKPAQIIKNGGIVIFPTETVYGIGTNALNEQSIKHLFEIKQRPLNKPISLLVNSMKMIEEIATDISDIEYALMKNFFPGPLTIILKKNNIIPNIVTSNSNTVGIRMPANKIALELLNYANIPIATTSSNLSGNPSQTNFENTIKDFKNSADYFINGGESEIGLASTVIQIVNNTPYILRQGSISEAEIKSFVKSFIKE